MLPSHHRFIDTPSGCERHMYQWTGAFKKLTKHKKVLAGSFYLFSPPGTKRGRLIEVRERPNPVAEWKVFSRERQFQQLCIKDFRFELSWILSSLFRGKLTQRLMMEDIRKDVMGKRVLLNKNRCNCFGILQLLFASLRGPETWEQNPNHLHCTPHRPCIVFAG